MVDTYHSFFKIFQICCIDVDKLLRVAIRKGEPTALHLDHQSMTLFKSVRHIGQFKFDSFYFPWLKGFGLFVTIAVFTSHDLSSYQHLVTTHRIIATVTTVGL